MFGSTTQPLEIGGKDRCWPLLNGQRQLRHNTRRAGATLRTLRSKTPT